MKMFPFNSLFWLALSCIQKSKDQQIYTILIFGAKIPSTSIFFLVKFLFHFLFIFDSCLLGSILSFSDNE